MVTGDKQEPLSSSGLICRAKQDARLFSGGRELIPLMKVHTPLGIAEAVSEVWESGFVTEGEYSDKFENAFAEYIGNPNTCLVNSCTSALVLAARVIGIKEGDEVISTAMTCMATNEPFFNCGAKLVFADIDSKTGNIDPQSIKEKITSRTKAIVVVHWAGQPCDMDEILQIAKEHNIKVVEDAAHALRSSYKGRLIGNHGDFVCYSFQAVKHLSTADGGAIACRKKEDAERIRKIRWFGLDRKYDGPSRWEQDITESGFKCHMNNTNAIIGLLQLKYIDDLIDRHIYNSTFLSNHINNKKVNCLSTNNDRVSSCWIHSVLVDDKKQFKQHLAKAGIHSDVAHVSNLRYSVFRKFLDPTLTNLQYFDKRLMNIPCGWWVSQEEIETIVDAVNDY
jgi:perosamine synthetase